MNAGTGFLSTLSRATIGLVAIETAIFLALAVASSAREQHQQQTREDNRLMVREIGLTDLALSNGTSYTRHPSQADLFAPSNEHPCAIEHFPAGSFLPPPVEPLGISPALSTGAVP